MSKWEEALWSELDAMTPEDQVVACGEWITTMTHELLTQLGRRRRQKVVEIIADPEWDAMKLAETIGTPVGTIRRLAEEGRAAARRENVVTHPPLPVA